MRQLVADIISVYEVNRKECARILLVDLPKWLAPGTFGSSSGESGPQISLENLVMDTVLAQLCATPASPHKAVYYHSLVTELCKVSPQTVAPALGKCIRKLYAGLGADMNAEGQFDEGVIVLGAEGARRFADWFGVHLSNFGFHWRWPEWWVRFHASRIYKPESFADSASH